MSDEQTETPLGRAMSLIAERTTTSAVAPDGPASADAPTPDAPPPAAEDEDLRLSKAQQVAIRREREAHEAKKQARELTERLKTYEALDSKDPKAVRALLSSRGITMEQLAKDALEAPDEEPEDETSAEVKTLKAKLEAIEKERLQAQQAEVYQQNIAHVSEILKAEADKYPALVGYKSAPKELVRRFEAHVAEHGEPPDIGELLKTFNDAVYSDVDSILASDVALKAYLARPDAKERVLSLLGIKSSGSPASDEGTGKRKGVLTAIPNSQALAAGTRDKSRPQTLEERVAMALQKIKR